MKVALRVPSPTPYAYAEFVIEFKEKSELIDQLAILDKDISDALNSTMQSAFGLTLLKTELGATHVADIPQPKSAKPWDKPKPPAPTQQAAPPAVSAPKAPSAASFF